MFKDIKNLRSRNYTHETPFFTCHIGKKPENNTCTVGECV